MKLIINSKLQKFRALKITAWLFAVIQSLVLAYWLYQIIFLIYGICIFKANEYAGQSSEYNWKAVWVYLLILFFLLGLFWLNIQVLFKPVTVKWAIFKLSVIFLLFIVPLTVLLYNAFVFDL